MKKINILGVGNALVDKQFLIDESFLKEISIDKGTMGLCDANYQVSADPLYTSGFIMSRATRPI